MAEYDTFRPWWIVIGLLVLFLALVGVQMAMGSLCVNPPPAEQDDPCYADLVIYNRVQSNGNPKEARYYSSGSVTVRDGMVFFQRRKTGTYFALPSDRVEIRYDFGACLECE